ncbi:hypothetical protein BN1232_06334 [Mycobacterium lentiflavum]|uniref:Site-specific integrase n=2 Tax=Mycobacterium simiae complex TaxID=2249310 RepID=A0A0E3WEE5_MYCLN|nr:MULTISPECIES: site-specific integrase [Mycobacterium simiae complex]ULP45553.1 site-specific integrase [Mycobacterium lentiflavum]CDO91615.1 hypothetical protein BN973_06024 [Mycobacterium triplex]CQD24700.1 hypothetical protein BN1232_06334 [Mycobacterium lentiflavum]
MPAVGIRRVVVLDKFGQASLCEINPDNYRCKRLAAQLADQWAHMATGLSRSAVYAHWQASDRYLNFVVAQGYSHVSLNETPEAVVTTLSAWSKSLLGKYGATSKVPYRLTNIVQAQLASAVSDGVVTDGVLCALALGPALIKRPVDRPLDEFGKAELQRMVLAARAHIRALRAIRDWAAKLIEANEHDGITDMAQRTVAEMLAMATSGSPVVVSGALDNTEMLAHFPAEAWSLYRPPSALANSGPSAKGWCVRAVMPATVDLTPFRVLLLATTGIAADEISSLRISDIEWQADGVRLQTNKPRAGRSKGRFFPVSQGGGWSVSGVLESLLEHTRTARALASGQISGELWLSVNWQRPDAECRYLPRQLRQASATTSLGYWLQRVGGVHEVGEVSLPHDLRRIRKAKLSERAIGLQGMFADIAGDEHTTRVFYTHYAHTTSLKVYSASVVSRFQRSLADAVTSGFTAFLKPRAEVPLTALTEALPIELSHARSLRSGEFDMGVVDCRDPFDSPFTVRGKLCGSAPLSCLVCENAVVFTDHLPNVLALVEAMDNIRRSMNPEEWIAIWGAQYDAAVALIESLPESVREAARQRMAQARTDLPSWLQRGAE